MRKEVSLIKKLKVECACKRIFWGCNI